MCQRDASGMLPEPPWPPPEPPPPPPPFEGRDAGRVRKGPHDGLADGEVWTPPPSNHDRCVQCTIGVAGGCPSCGLDSNRVTAFIAASRASTDGRVQIDLESGAMSPANPRDEPERWSFHLSRVVAALFTEKKAHLNALKITRLEARCETLEALWATGTLERSRRVHRIERAIEGLQRAAGIPKNERLI